MKDANDLPTAPPPGRGLYCNRTLNLRAIPVIGYDMDYTLVHYRVEDWERRAYGHLRGRLARDGWPVDDLEFDPKLVIRGLIVDTELGNVLKTNRFGYVKTAFHGSRRMDLDALRQAYRNTPVDLSDRRFSFANTLFSLSECCMYMQLVDLLEARALGDSRAGYHDLWRAVRARVDATHTEGELKAEIMAAPERFVERDPETVLALLDQRKAGKRLLLITNSEWPYTVAMMRYCFDPFLPDGMTWRQLFELTVVAARKPSFFETTTPLLRIADQAGLLSPHVGPLEAHGCYYGGNAGLVERHLGVSGDEILYLGDHMYGDVHVTKRALSWRTGLVLRELEDELGALDSTRAEQAELSELMRQKEALEYRHCQLRLAQQRRKASYGPPVDTSQSELSRRMNDLRQQLGALDERIGPLASHAGSANNPNWGLLMRAGNDKSQLAHQVERHADFYTSRVSNLLYATPFAYLRSRAGTLPHDPV